MSPVKASITEPESKAAAAIRQLLTQQQESTLLTAWAKNLTKEYCKGSRVKYQAGYAPSPDPCSTINSTTSTSTSQ